MNAAAIGDFLAAIGAVGTFVAILVSIHIEKKARKERRIEAVIGRYLDLKQKPEHQLLKATTFIHSGAIFLSRDELEECLLILEAAGEGNPLGIGLEEPAVLRRARENNVNLDDWAERVSFLIGDAVNPGSVRGYGIFRMEPWHLAGVYKTKKEAEQKRDQSWPGYEVKFGSHRPETDDFVVSAMENRTL